MAKGKQAEVVSGGDMLTGEKTVHTFRLPNELVAAMRAEAERGGYDLTALVVRLMNGFLTDFGLPRVATRLLDEDRAALQMDRHQYLAHLLFERSYEIRSKGLGFDDPDRPKKKGG
jgi:hypothetical protein